MRENIYELSLDDLALIQVLKKAGKVTEQTVSDLLDYAYESRKWHSILPKSAEDAVRLVYGNLGVRRI